MRKPMSKRVLIPVLALAGLVLAALAAPLGAQEKSRDPDNKHAVDLYVRPAAEYDFDKTKKYGVEVYTEPDGNGIYISDVGSVSAVPARWFKVGDSKPKNPKWQHGLKLAVLKPGEAKTTKETKSFGIEVFKDEQNGNLIYISETGQLDTVAAGNARLTTEKVKNPTSLHGFNLKVRKAGEKEFKEARKVAIEAYLDENNDTLVYLSETGSVAVVPAKLTNAGGMGKDPVWKHGMEVQVRKAGEKERTKDTKKFGIEVFSDENNGNLVYLSETGSIAVVPAKLAKPTPAETKDPIYRTAMDLSVRKAGEKEFTKETKKFGIEVFSDENNGNLIFISQTGDLAVVPGKTE